MIFKSYILEENNKNFDKKAYLFYGENLGLKNDLKKKVKSQFKENEIIIFFQENLIQKEYLLIEEIKNISLFEKEKIFLIENVNDKILEIIKEALPTLENQKVFLFAESLDKKSKIRSFFEKSEICGAVACYPDNEITIKKILATELKNFEGLTPYNLNLIFDNVNLDRAKLRNELEKIKICFKNKKIEADKLEILLNLKVNDDFNQLRDEALDGNKFKTNKLLSETVFESEKAIFYINSINQRLTKLYEVRKMGDKNIENNINNLKPPIFWKDKTKFINQAKKWTISKINNIEKKTYNLEIKVKSNSIIDKNFLVKKLLIDICLLANL